jgi:hypothetical protein
MVAKHCSNFVTIILSMDKSFKGQNISILTTNPKYLVVGVRIKSLHSSKVSNTPSIKITMRVSSPKATYIGIRNGYLQVPNPIFTFSLSYEFQMPTLLPNMIPLAIF